MVGIGLSLADENAATVVAIAAFLLAVWSLVERAQGSLGNLTRRSTLKLGIVAVVVHAVLMILAAPLREPHLLAIHGLTAGLLIIASLSARLRVLTAVAGISLQTLWLIALVAAAVPANMDVYMFQQEAAAALLAGANPYELRYPNIYGPGTPLYGSEVVEGGFLTFGFPYPPLSLAMALPPYMLAGDYRYGLVAAVLVTALIIAFIRPSQYGPLVAGIYLLSPMTLRVVANGWTEPFLALAAALVLVAAVRRLPVVPFALGALVALKQYAFPVLIVAAAVLPKTRAWSRPMTAGVALAVAAASVLPSLILAPGPFIYSVGVVQVLQPFRMDSVSLPGLVARLGGPETPAFVAILVLLMSALAVAIYDRRSSAAFATACAVVFMAFFLMSKQAFLNYYFLTFTFLALAAALSFRTGGTAARPAEQETAAREERMVRR